MTYTSFVAFVRAAVLPLRAAHPDRLRLDGGTTAGNREVFGRFTHNGTTWRVHADTHVQPLLIALAAAERGADPFVEKPTSDGRSLKLAEEIRPDPTAPQHLYVYADR